MQEKMKKFLKILRIELEDIENDISMLVNLHLEREKKKEITHYVCRENLALLNREISDLHIVLRYFDSLSLEAFDSLEQMIEEVDKRIKAKTEEMQFDEVVYNLIKRKIEKVKMYVHNE